MDTQYFEEYFADFLKRMVFVPTPGGDTDINRLLSTVRYLLKSQGQCVYVKTVGGRVVVFMPLFNEFFWNKWQTYQSKRKEKFTGFVEYGTEDMELDGRYVVPHLPSDTTWLEALMNRLCSEREVPDRDLLLCVHKTSPSIKTDGTYADDAVYHGSTVPVDVDAVIDPSPVLSLSTGRGFLDIAFPRPRDVERMTLPFAAINTRHMKWVDKKESILWAKEEVPESAVDMIEDGGVAPIPDSPSDPANFFDYKIIACRTRDGLPPTRLDEFMFAGCCVVVVGAIRFHNWFSRKMVAGRHYLVTEVDNASRFVDNIGDDVARSIAAEARLFAIKELSSTAVLDAAISSIERSPVYDYGPAPPSVLQFELQRAFLSRLYHRRALLPVSSEKLTMPDDRRRRNKALAMVLAGRPEIVDDLDQVFVKRYDDAVSGINDAFIGSRVVNEIECPNFVYTFLSRVDEYSGSALVCSERINGDTMDVFLKKHPKRFYELFIQICLSLQMAFERHVFVHGKLDPENIVVNELASSQKHVYRMLDGTIYSIESRFVPVIHNFSASKAMVPQYSEDNVIYVPINKRIMSGKMESDDLNDLLHVDGGSDTKRLLLRLGRKVSSRTEQSRSPIDTMKSVVNKQDITDNKVRFGKLRTDVEVDPVNARLEFDRMTALEPVPEAKVAERVFANPLPVENSSLGNVILKYEITNSLKSALGNVKVDVGIDLTTSKNIERAIRSVVSFYNDVIDKSGGVTIQDADDDGWGLHILASKYWSAISEHPNVVSYMNKFRHVAVLLFEEMLRSLMINTRAYFLGYQSS
ncbi:hypothetical protein AV955_gp105 [Diadromus pulchellus ascovirus 4a]|uniref:Complete DpAV4 genome n=1 Tax=Diadromus pulchellus ascovirus 4a TaxID=158683 RepID=F2NZ34_9VIRU|nr:hypothetical protein AV955_gp105 [Diadromus pulchellus ascovirus 4a]CCA61462.1 unnamed protein product [Diadromus pulchellus ascovirus 4a]